MTNLLACLLLVGGWYDTVPEGTFEGEAYWVQDYNRPWEWEPYQPVGEVEFTIRNGQINGFLDLPVEAVTWFDNPNHPVRFYNEPTPRGWREAERYPWLFRVHQFGTGATISTGPWGQYSPWNIHAEWNYGWCAFNHPPHTGLSFRWKEVDGQKHVFVYGFWAAYPSQHYMSLGFEMWEKEE